MANTFPSEQHTPKKRAVLKPRLPGQPTGQTKMNSTIMDRMQAVQAAGLALRASAAASSRVRPARAMVMPEKMPEPGTAEYDAKFAETAERYRKRSEELAAQKKARAPPIIAKPCPRDDTPAQKKTEAKCQARTLENRPCNFRATSKCGRFCARHNIVV